MSVLTDYNMIVKCNTKPMPKLISKFKLPIELKNIAKVNYYNYKDENDNLLESVALIYLKNGLIYQLEALKESYVITKFDKEYEISVEYDKYHNVVNKMANIYDPNDLDVNSNYLMVSQANQNDMLFRELKYCNDNDYYKLFVSSSSLLDYEYLRQYCLEEFSSGVYYSKELIETNNSLYIYKSQSASKGLLEYEFSATPKFQDTESKYIIEKIDEKLASDAPFLTINIENNDKYIVHLTKEENFKLTIIFNDDVKKYEFEGLPLNVIIMEEFDNIKENILKHTPKKYLPIINEFLKEITMHYYEQRKIIPFQVIAGEAILLKKEDFNEMLFDLYVNQESYIKAISNSKEKKETLDRFLKKN